MVIFASGYRASHSRRVAARRPPESRRSAGPAAIALILLLLVQGRGGLSAPHLALRHVLRHHRRQRWPQTIGTITGQEKHTTMRNGIIHFAGTAALVLALSATSALAQKKYDTGATDTEIKVGQTVPFSGPASAYATIGKAQAAYIKMINDQGGVNGRKITLIQYDDAYSPPK